MAQLVKNIPAMQETWVWLFGVLGLAFWLFGFFGKGYPLQYSGLALWGDCVISHILVCISESFFSLLGNIPLHEYIPVCVSTAGHLGFFQDLKIMDKAAMNILSLFLANLDIFSLLP